MPGVVLFLLLCLTGLGACRSADSNASNDATPVLSGPPRTAFPMPPLSAGEAAAMGWITGDGKEQEHMKLSDYAGRVVVLDFYATWCVPCRDSIPHLIDLQERYGPSGLEIIGLNVGGPDDRVKVADFSKELNIQYSLGFPDKTLTDLFLSDSDAIPQSFVFDREGTLVNRFIGYNEAIGKELEETITTALR